MSNKAMFTSPEDVFVNQSGQAVDRKSPDRFMKLVAAGQAIALEDAVRAGVATSGGAFVTPNIPDEKRPVVETIVATDQELGKGPKASDDKKLTKANEEIATLKKQVEDLKAAETKMQDDHKAEVEELQEKLTKANEEIATLKAASAQSAEDVKAVDPDAKAKDPEKDKAVQPAQDKAVKPGDNK